MDTTKNSDYEEFLKSLMPSKSAIETAKYEAKEEGREQGREEAISEKNMQFIVNSYKKGLSIELIAEIVSVSEEEVRKVLQENELL